MEIQLTLAPGTFREVAKTSTLWLGHTLTLAKTHALPIAISVLVLVGALFCCYQYYKSLVSKDLTDSHLPEVNNIHTDNGVELIDKTDKGVEIVEPKSLDIEINDLITEAKNYINSQIQLTDNQRLSLLNDFKSLEPTIDELENQELLKTRKIQLENMQRTINPFLKGRVNPINLPEFPDYGNPDRCIVPCLQSFNFLPFEYLLYRPIKIPARRYYNKSTVTAFEKQTNLKAIMLKLENGKPPSIQEVQFFTRNCSLQDFHSFLSKIISPLCPSDFRAELTGYRENPQKGIAHKDLVVVDGEYERFVTIKRNGNLGRIDNQPFDNFSFNLTRGKFQVSTNWLSS